MQARRNKLYFIEREARALVEFDLDVMEAAKADLENYRGRVIVAEEVVDFVCNELGTWDEDRVVVLQSNGKLIEVDTKTGDIKKGRIPSQKESKEDLKLYLKTTAEVSLKEIPEDLVISSLSKEGEILVFGAHSKSTKFSLVLSMWRSHIGGFRSCVLIPEQSNLPDKQNTSCTN